MKIRTVLFAAAWLFSGLVHADPPHQHKGPDMDRIALLLDLDEQQKSEVQKVLEAQHQTAHDTIDQERADGQRPSGDEMRARHEKLKQETLDKLGGVLNEQQLKKFAALTDHPPGARHGHGHSHPENEAQDPAQP